VQNGNSSLVDAENISSLEPQKWFAIRVKSQREKSVAAAIGSKGFEEFLPLYESRRRWSDRLKSRELPLFPGYVFCHIDPNGRLPILTIPSVLHFVGIGKTPAPIDESEIAAVQSAVRSGLRVEPSDYLEVGQCVRLEDGPLAGLEGILTEVRKQFRVVVSLTLLKRSVAVEIDRHWLSRLSPKQAPAFAPGYCGSAILF
jgi:transcription antitermination factor NusG